MDEAAQAKPTGPCVHYQRRRPEQTTLYQLVQEHVETFFAQVERETGAGLPDFVTGSGLRLCYSKNFWTLQ